MKPKWLTLGWALASAGCSYSVPQAQVPPHLPAYGAIDVAASEVVVTDLRDDLDPEDATEVREEIAEVLAEAGRPDQSGAPPARFRARVSMIATSYTTSSPSPDGSAAALIGTVTGTIVFCMPFGCNVEFDEVAVTLTLDVAGTRYEGSGRGGQWGSIYAPSRHRALSRAVQAALLDAQDKAAQARTTSGGVL